MYREREEELDCQGLLLIGNELELEFLVGNHYKHLSGNEAKKNSQGITNEHRWTGFIRLKNESEQHLIHKLINKVVFELDEDFRYPSKTHVPGSI